MIKTDFLFLSQQLLWPTIIAISCDHFSFQNEVNPQTFNFSFEINFQIKRLRTSPRFKTKARVNSKMAY